MLMQVKHSRARCQHPSSIRCCSAGMSVFQSKRTLTPNFETLQQSAADADQLLLFIIIIAEIKVRQLAHTHL